VLRGRLSGEAPQGRRHRQGRARADPHHEQERARVLPTGHIPAGTYAWQPKAVSTAAVKAVLVSFDFRRRDCDNVGRFAQLLSRGLDNLQKNGHAKWKAVDLNYPLRGWEQYDCVRKYLGKAAPATTAPGQPRSSQNPVFDAIKGALDQ